MANRQTHSNPFKTTQTPCNKRLTMQVKLADR